MDTRITVKEFLKAIQDFVSISDKLHDGWKLFGVEEMHRSYMKKETYISAGNGLLKAEYVVFYNLSYGVPSFSFNIWNSSGTLLNLDEIRQMAVTQTNEKDFYSVITQQEHPVLLRPYFIMHPCHTEELLILFKDKSKNIIVTFLGLISPLLPHLDLSLEYGL